MKARTFFIFTMLLIILLAGHCNAQSFTPHRGLPEGHNRQCAAVHHQKTVGQKVRNKVKYAAKRHNNEGFSLRETRRKVRKQGFKI